ncbi:MAG: MFS transporter, partial [Pseudomonadota bacterium]
MTQTVTEAEAGAASRHAPLTLGAFVALMAALMSVNALATDIMLPGFPQIAEALAAASTTEVQAIVTAYMMGFGLGQFVVGILSDRYGRRPVLGIGLAIYTVMSVASAFAPDLAWLLIVRFVQGLA